MDKRQAIPCMVLAIQSSPGLGDTTAGIFIPCQASSNRISPIFSAPICSLNDDTVTTLSFKDLYI